MDAFVEYYRCPAEYAQFDVLLSSSCQTSYSVGIWDVTSGRLLNATSRVDISESQDQSLEPGSQTSSATLPFDLTKVVTNIRQERYVEKIETSPWKKAVRHSYYAVRPCMPVKLRRHLQRAWLKGWDTKRFPSWPVDQTVDKLMEKTMVLSLRSTPASRVPFIWFWPEGKSSCAVMTHDVETDVGLSFCPKLMDIDDAYGIKSSFQIIPEARYIASNVQLDEMRTRGFEINVHDLRHDGYLFREPAKFEGRAARINEYAVFFGSKGFRSGVLYRNLDWYGAFKFSYDMSVPNVGHLDPQPGGCCTVMPFFVGNILELPVTTVQDYSLFHILGCYSTDLWERQINLIRQHHGFISFIVHPDYLDTERARTTYRNLLHVLAELRAQANVWVPTPGEVDTWWRQRSQMRLVRDGINWRVEGPGAERATIAYATLDQDTLAYSVN